MGQQRRYGTSRGIIAAALALCVMPAIGGCVARDYAGIPLQPGAAPADLQALAMRARAGDKRAQFDLGRLYETGEAVPQNISNARILYVAAATDSGGTRKIFVPQHNRSVSTIPINVGAQVDGLPEAKAALKRLSINLSEPNSSSSQIGPSSSTMERMTSSSSDIGSVGLLPMLVGTRTEKLALRDLGIGPVLVTRTHVVRGPLKPAPAAEIEDKLCRDLIPIYSKHYGSVVTHCYAYRYFQTVDRKKTLFLLDISLSPEREKELSESEHNSDDRFIYSKMLQMNFVPEDNKLLYGRFLIETIDINHGLTYNFLIRPIISK